MSNDLFCPRCESSEYILQEKDIKFNSISADVANGLLTTGITVDRAVALTCSTCGHQYKTGDYQKRQQKLAAARLALAATQDGNQNKAAAIYGLLGISIVLIAYKFFITNYTIFGFVCSVIASALLLIAITGFIFTPKRK